MLSSPLLVLSVAFMTEESGRQRQTQKKTLEATTSEHVHARCTRCSYTGPRDSFPLMAKLQRSTQCLECATYRRQVNQKRREKRPTTDNKENISPSECENKAEDDDITKTPALRLTPRVDWKSLACHLANCTVEEVDGLDLLVALPKDVSTRSSKGCREALANEVLTCSGYRFK